jgi:predicted ABC-type ATPase
MNKPYAIVTIGPTGSGKSSLVKKVLDHLKTQDIHLNDSAFEKIIIDDIIENHDGYKHKIDAILTKIKSNIKPSSSNTQKITKETIDELVIDDDFISKYITDFNSAYFETRRQKCYDTYTNNNTLLKNYINPKEPTESTKSTTPTKPTKQEEPPKCIKDLQNQKTKFQKPENANNDSFKTCDYVNDTKLCSAIINKKNIILESTGTYIPEWLIEYLNEGYTIFFAYTLVSYEELKERNTSRFKTMLKDYLFDNEDNKKPVPRLPNISDEYFIETIIEIKKILIKIIDTCFQNSSQIYNSKQLYCDINLLIFNNNNTEPNGLIYDSKNSAHDIEKTKSDIEEILTTPSQSSPKNTHGGFYNTKNKTPTYATKKRSTKKRSTKKRSTKKRSAKKRSAKKRSAKNT